MNLIKLNEVQTDEIRKLAGEKRRSLGFIGETPIANDIFTILENLNIRLLEYPIPSESNRPAFSAAIIYTEEYGNELAFIGINTSDYYDKQIFAVAHELYHYFTKTDSHLSRFEGEEHNMNEVKANRFAAEFLLPETVLQSIVIEEFRTSSLKKIQQNTLVRFIARLHCTWWLPFRSLVKRLHEIKAITSVQYAELYEIDERDLTGYYGKIGQAINKDVFTKLNTSTQSIGAAPNDIEVIIRNFEDHLIDEDQFTKILSLFNKTPDEFGYNLNVSEEDSDAFESYFSMEDEDED